MGLLLRRTSFIAMYILQQGVTVCNNVNLLIKSIVFITNNIMSVCAVKFPNACYRHNEKLRQNTIFPLFVSYSICLFDFTSFVISPAFRTTNT